MATRTSLVTIVRFGLEQLGAKNKHHEFEKLAMALARARIASNLLPATGPVSAGGDQGRDFETFRTYYVPDPSARTPFRRLASTEPISFTATTEKTRHLAAKIKDDVATTMRTGTPPKVIFAFSSTDLPVASRNRVKAWAQREHSVQLEILDGQAISEQLADADTFWIAETYLDLPAEVMPPSPAPGDIDWYTNAVSRWRAREPDPHRVADFYFLKAAAREAAFKRKQAEDVRLWIGKLEVFRRRDRIDSIARSATYEIAVAHIVGLGTLAGQEDDVRRYFAQINGLRDHVELEDATVLLVHVGTAIHRGITSLSKDEVDQWQRMVRRTVDQWLRAGCTHNQKCALLEIKGVLVLLPEPGTIVLRNLDEAIEQWFKLTRAVGKARLYPLERFADRLTNYIGWLGEHPRFAELTGVVDSLLAKRTGSFAAAAKARDRAMVFMKQKGMEEGRQAAPSCHAELVL